MFRNLALVSVLFASSLSLADDPANTARWTVVSYARQIVAMKEFAGRTDPKLTAAACHADIAAARNAGVAKLAHNEYKAIGGTPSGSTYEITLDRADALCTEYGAYEAVGKRFKIFEQAQTDMSIFRDNNGSAEYAAQALKDVATCRTAVDEILAANVPATHEVKFASSAITVGELKAKVCDALATAASKYATKLDDADRARTEKFTKVGVAGDKLALFKRSWGFLFLAGGASSDDVKKYAAAALVFEWTSSDADGAGYVTHTVRRYQFKGNKLVGTTEKTYRKPKGAPIGDVFR